MAMSVQPPMKFSPHAWGWTVVGVPQTRFYTVFPTRVGVDRG